MLEIPATETVLNPLLLLLQPHALRECRSELMRSLHVCLPNQSQQPHMLPTMSHVTLRVIRQLATAAQIGWIAFELMIVQCHSKTLVAQRCDLIQLMKVVTILYPERPEPGYQLLLEAPVCVRM